MSNAFGKIFVVVLFIHIQLQAGFGAFGLSTSNHSDAPPMYDDKNPDDQFTMLISGGYRPKNPKYTKFVVSIRTARATAYFGDNHFCAGTIIASRLVVTAAHCIMDSNKIVTRPRRLVVVAGCPNRLVRTRNTVEMLVETVIAHEQFIRKGGNDIALLRLKKPIPDDLDHINMMPLINEDVLPGTVCTVVGWGQLFYRGPYAALIVYVDLNILPTQECHNLFPAERSFDLMCASKEKDWESDVCRGDSGGPLICNDKLAGIVSWGAPCGLVGFPSAFSNVFYHRHWIEKANTAHVFQPSKSSAIILLILLVTWSVFVERVCFSQTLRAVQ